VEFDLVVVGAGAAGLSAARTARRRGARVALVSDGPFGGDCTFYGCVPSKTLIEAASQDAHYETAAARLKSTIEQIAATENSESLRREGITTMAGTARLDGPKQLLVDGKPISWHRLVIATGSRPAVPPIPGIGSVRYLTNETVFDLQQLPASLTIVGGGPIGVELGQAFARFGTAVTIIEAGPAILSREEPDASRIAAQSLNDDGVRILTGSTIRSVSTSDKAVTAELGDGTVPAEQVLVAVGRQACTDRIGAGDAGARLDSRGHLDTDAHMRTTLPDIYAAGDVTGRALFTHAADEMGRVAAANALARIAWHRFNEEAIPAVTYTAPEIARVGLTEHAAAAKYDNARVAELPLNELDRAVTAAQTDGYIKLIVAPRPGTRSLAGGQLVGATIVAARAGEMIAVPTLAIRTRMFPARLALTVQAYPTWTLGVRQAAAQLFIETGGRTARPARRTDDPQGDQP
jgi:pyruvate/2-oxoglutarate dehydrogenase complex dihydrolipoamide dehydrogenase (E3) component